MVTLNHYLDLQFLAKGETEAAASKSRPTPFFRSKLSAVSRYIGALPGRGAFIWHGSVAATRQARSTEAAAHSDDVDRILTTLLFTDIVNATETAAALGDRRWCKLLRTHHAVVRRELERSCGTEIDVAGDGFFASFARPASAIYCASRISHSLRTLDLWIRAGIHIGECALIGDKPGGIAVHIASRIAAEARPGEVLVSGTVKDVVTGSSLQFEDRGHRVLKGVPAQWQLFAVKLEALAALP